MPLSFANDTAFHEAGHTLITYLNSDFFTINYVTIDTEISKSRDTRSVGGISARLLKEPSLLSLMEHDKLCICSLAGIAADDVNYSDGKISYAPNSINIWETKLSSHKYSGDCYILRNHLSVIDKYLTVDHRTYLKNCQELMYSLFTDEHILLVLLMVKDMLNAHQSVTEEAINSLLETTALRDWRLEKWDKTFLSRQQTMYNII